MTPPPIVAAPEPTYAEVAEVEVEDNKRPLTKHDWTIAVMRSRSRGC